MNTIFKSALNQIKTEEVLVNKTEIYLKDTLSNNKKPKLVNLFKTKAASRFFIAAASFLVILVGGSSAAYAYYQTPVAYLSLDINPSVELGVNAFGKVVNAEGYNEDGQTILAGTDVTGSTVEDAVQCLIMSADDKGYIANDGSTVISLTSETNNTNKATILQTKSELGVNHALQEIEKQAIVQKDNVALERRDEAKQLGITPGKLNLINKLQAVDPTATIDDYKDASVKEIMKNIKFNENNSKSNSDNDNLDNDNSDNDNLNNDNLDILDDLDKLDKLDDSDDSRKVNTKDTTVNNSTTSATEETKKSNDYKSDNANVTKSQTIISEISTKNATEDIDNDSDRNKKLNVESHSNASSESNTKVDSKNNSNPIKVNTPAATTSSVNKSK
ncbi:anti-sigma-I factor RsgI family protein [[Clostridium] fimetarium]|uniref:Anti-sigma factor RsgI-like middle domain-containing protein n=1 Tax=[Clostridium] fimetarium TaxID=99656 RepID=A0A1I0RZZ2_9FIRM|nr:hypothetical protein [[Clostridium] fimetarium]SEW46533.1 hypothetical protein SAMN05421659_1344 [[Clostridium] fimetarium]